MFDTRINFQRIKDTVQAAELLQEAGRTTDCSKILNDMAKEITKELKK